MGICQTCGLEFHQRPADLRRGFAKYCSRSCRARVCKRTPEEAFWRRVNKTSNCWLWTGAHIPKGYGHFVPSPNRPKIYVHRFSYQIHFGEIPKGLLVCHRCDNPPCVRPDHLFLGTHKDNFLDMRLKNRAHKVLTVEEVKAIKQELAEKQGVRGVRPELARRYGVTENAIHKIMTGKSWAHVQAD